MAGRANWTGFWHRWGRVLAPASWPDELAAWLTAEHDRWILWVPPLVGIGIGIYFALPGEPTWPWAWAAVGLTMVASGLTRPPGWRTAVLILATVALGFAAAQWRTARVAGPVLQKRLTATLTGQVVAVELRDGAERYVLDRLTIPPLAAAQTPIRVRVTNRRQGELPAPGQWISVRATLLPPAEPAAPGAYDFGRAAWFQQLGAVGFTLGALRIVPAPEGVDRSLVDALRLRVTALRQRLTERIMAALPEPTGAIAAALMTGDQGPIPDDVIKAYQDSGIAHILSVSGLHIALVAGLLFFAIRGGLALWERVALRYPTKKWAAAAAIAGTFAYTVISGWQVAAVRSFLMSALVLLAVIIDRNALSMRSVAVAALAILLIAPESMFDPSFQMSFASVVALIAAYESVSVHQWAKDHPWRWAIVYVGGSAMTTLVAGFAAAPFAAYYFDRFVNYAQLANSLAVPLSSFWIMPWAVVAFLLMPFGLESLALVPMGWGIEAMTAIARWVAGLPGAVALVPAMPMIGLILFTLGGLWLTIWRGRPRWLGVVPMVVGCLSPWLLDPPRLLVDGDARYIAIRGDAGWHLWATRANPRGMVVETWLRRAGQEHWLAWPESDDDAVGAIDLRCDDGACRWRLQGWQVALIRREGAIAADCRSADIIIALVPVRGRCPSARIVVDRFDLWRNGTHALSLGAAGPQIETVRGWRGARPWVLARGGDFREPRSRVPETIVDEELKDE